MLFTTATERKRIRSKHQEVGRWCRVDKRLAIYIRDSFRCIYCGCDVSGGVDSVKVGTTASLDHVKPQSLAKGKKDHSPANLVTCCNKCNSKRGAAPVAKFATKRALARVKQQTKKSIADFRAAARVLLECAGMTY